MMSFFRAPDKENNQAASTLLAALAAHHPFPFDAYLQQLAQGIHPATVGAAIGQALAEREQQYTRIRQECDYWRERAESYRLAWEGSQNQAELGEAKARITTLVAELAAEKENAERQSEALAYLQSENERLKELIRTQNTIIAEQHMQLAAWDEQA